MAETKVGDLTVDELEALIAKAVADGVKRAQRPRDDLQALSMTETARRLGVSRRTLDHLRSTGEIDLPTVQIGRRQLVPLASIERLLASDEG